MSRLNDYLIHLLTEDPDKRIPHDSDVDPSESTIVTSLENALNETDIIWAADEIDLWQQKAQAEGRAIPPQQVIREFKHPLQPDIDLLVGPESGGKGNSPLIGIEAKYFSKYNGIQGHNLLPKRVDANGNDTGGFYSGLDQALSLLSMGLDRIYLWHVFKIDEEIYTPDSAGGDQTHDHRDILKSYTHRIRGVLDDYDIPIGYVAHGIAVDFDNKFIQLCTPRKAPVVDDNNTGVRSLVETAIPNQDHQKRSESGSTASEYSLADLQGSGNPVTVEAEVKSIVFVKKDQPHTPDLKGLLQESGTGIQTPFIVDSGVKHPYFKEGARFRFENARDHQYNGEIQVRITDDTTIQSQ